MRGRPRKPTAIKRLEGNRSGKPLPEKEPQPDKLNDKDRKTLPEWCTPDVMSKFDEVCSVLSRMDCLTIADKDAVLNYAIAWCEWERCCKFVQKHGDTYESDGRNGLQIKERPEAKRQWQLYTTMRHYQCLLGLNPSSRGKIEVLSSKGSGQDDEPSSLSDLRDRKPVLKVAQ